MDFQEALTQCIKTPELVQEFNRLTGCSLGIDDRPPVVRLIDEATGYQLEVDKKNQEQYVRIA